MTIDYPDYYKNFQCIGSDCKDTCCAGWDVVIDEKTAAFYKTIDGELGERLRSALYTEDGEILFRLRENGDCPFLNCERLCDIHAALGHEHLSRTCAMFPRYINDFGGYREVGLSMSCPVAVEMIVTKKDTAVYIDEKTDEAISAPNDIDPQKFMALKKSRTLLLSILQNKNEDIFLRLMKALAYCEYVDKILKRKVYKKLDYSFQDFKLKVGKKSEKIFSAWFHELSQMEFLRASWGETLKSISYKDFCRFDLDKEIQLEFEQIAVYYIHRYYLKSVYGGRAYDAIKAAILSLCVCAAIIQSTGADLEARLDIYKNYSKEIEHCPENMDKLKVLFSKSRNFSEKAINSVLL